ncbi:glutamine amidotransferase [Herbaspirillum sp. alder98]|uniref:glutamine amidotransferase n=1 Tax=Herbaspirillum sp. alder98 TaxID=2913096 RepID=UPI001CD8FB71|nr:glutamine amidotransferase [Herbaspirillum sp. alder98]MCA1323902.1 glutamine amidotransferase [Herbaspirillum sp. alder98]
MPAPVLIIQTGDANQTLKSSYGGYAQQIQSAAGLCADEIDVVNVCDGQSLRSACSYRAVFITGSPAMVTDREDWSERTAEWLREAALQEMPMFGICYGHQLLTHAFGGEVGYNPSGRAAGTMHVEMLECCRKDPLLAELPPTFPAHMLHMQSVLRPQADATVMARSPMDPHHMLKHADNIYSTQFHPEFSPDFVRAHLNYYADVYRGCGIDALALREKVSDTPQSTGLLRRFLALHARH